MSYNQNDFITYTLLGTLGCILAGVLFFGFTIFNIYSPLFQFIAFGIAGSVSFYLFKSGRTRDAIFINILLFVILFLISGQRFFLTQLLYFLALVLSVYFFSTQLYTKMTERNYIRPVVLSALIVISFLLVYWILFLIFYNPGTHVLPFKNLFIGSLTGLGLGIGFEMANLLSLQKNKM